MLVDVAVLGVAHEVAEVHREDVVASRREVVQEADLVGDVVVASRHEVGHAVASAVHHEAALLVDEVASVVPDKRSISRAFSTRMFDVGTLATRRFEMMLWAMGGTDM